jgi:hypothetical protein
MVFWASSGALTLRVRYLSSAGNALSLDKKNFTMTQIQVLMHQQISAGSLIAGKIDGAYLLSFTDGTLCSSRSDKLMAIK